MGIIISKLKMIFKINEKTDIDLLDQYQFRIEESQLDIDELRIYPKYDIRRY